MPVADPLVDFVAYKRQHPDNSWADFTEARRSRNRTARAKGEPDPYPSIPPDVRDEMLRAVKANPRKPEDFEQNLLDAVKSSSAALPRISRMEIDPPHHIDRECEMGVMVSDIHIGEEVSPTETGGIGAYNFDIFKERRERFTDEILRIGMQEAEYNGVKRLNVFLLGDLVDGWDIYRGQANYQDLGVVDQVVEAARELAVMFIRWSALFDHVVVFDVVGNHGRMGRKGEYPVLQSFDYLTYLMLEQQCANNPRIVFHHSKSWFQVVERGISRFVLLHGDDIKAWMGIPFYGMERAERRYSKLLGMNTDYLCVGHHHTPAKTDSVMANGSWVGPNAFSKVIVNGSLPTQKAFGIDHEFGITWTRDVPLVSWRELRQICIERD